MSLLTPLRKASLSPAETRPAVAVPEHPDFTQTSETTVYVTNTRAGEIAARFVRLYGNAFLEHAGVSTPEKRASQVQEMTHVLPLLGWEAAVASEFKRHTSPYKTGEKGQVVKEPVVEYAYAEELRSVHDERVKRHIEENTLSGDGAALIMGSIALGLREIGDRNESVSQFDAAHAHDMLAAGSASHDNPQKFHYDLI